jgi:hypothetical protein
MRHQMDAIIARRGNAARNIDKVAAARTLLTSSSMGYATEKSVAWPGKDAA